MPIWVMPLLSAVATLASAIHAYGDHRREAPALRVVSEMLWTSVFGLFFVGTVAIALDLQGLLEVIKIPFAANMGFLAVAACGLLIASYLRSQSG